MASLALGVVGSAFGGPIGGFIGATIGGLIDNALFGNNQKSEGPRLNDLSVTASTYGVAIPLLYGPENRCAGNVIWSTGLIETATTEEAGGKGGGPSVETTNYSYRASVAISLSRRRINRIKRVWANSKVIFDLAAATVQPDPATPLVGMVASAANGTHAVFDTLRVYQGNGTQQIDPTIEAHLGVGNVPAYRHTAYVVIKDMQLADFGNTLPNLEFEVEADEAITDGAIVNDIFARSGIDDGSASALRTLVRGFMVSRAGSALAAIEPLSIANNFQLSEQRGQVRCVRRGMAMKGVIPIGDMGASEAGGEHPEPIRFDRGREPAMPRQAAVSFIDPNLDYQTNTQVAQRRLGSSENNRAVQLPMTIEDDRGRQIADRVLWGDWAARRTARFAVSDRWSRMSPADVYGLPMAGAIVPFAINRATRGANGVIDCEAQFEDPEVYNSDAPGAPGFLPANGLQLPGPTDLVLLDMPIMRAVDDDPGFYYAVNAASNGWRGAVIWRSADGGVTYNQMVPIAVRSVIGEALTALPAGPTEFWDRGNVVRIELAFLNHDLESKSELSVLNGANAAWIGPANGQGGEIIQFASAQLVGPNTYDLRDLLRGRLGTEHAIGGHAAGDIFVLLNSRTMGRNDYSSADWGKARLFKPVSVLTTLVDTPAQAFTNTGEGKRPLSPVHVHGARDGANDLTITWARRSRLLAPGLGNGPVPLGEETEAYEVDILVAGNPVRTIPATTPAATYTAAQQAADGIVPGNPVTLAVYQLSTIRGRGRPANATV